VTSCTKQLHQIDGFAACDSKETKRTSPARYFSLPKMASYPSSFCFELRDQLLDALLVRRQNAELLEHSFHNNTARNRFKLCILMLATCKNFGEPWDRWGSARVQTRASRCSGRRRAIRTPRSRRLAAQRGVRGRATMTMERVTW